MTLPQSQSTLGIDFGTSNSAVGLTVNGKAHLIDVEPGGQTLPTSVFFDPSLRRALYGSPANAALIEGREGRFMRSLKRVLGTPLMHESRHIQGERLTFVDIIGRFLATLKARAEAACFQSFDSVVSGRPVHFHTNDPERDAQALADLTACYEYAGFRDIRFLAEPEAAARAYGALDTDTLALIVDIGGGTSDFSVFRGGASGTEILASHGVRIGGTNFDKSLSVDHVMPLFGRGSDLRKEMGPGVLRAPGHLFQDLASWEKIPFLYSGELQRDVARMEKLAVNPEKFARLGTVLEHHLGHDVAFAVEKGKIAANTPERDAAIIDLKVVQPRLAVPLTKTDLAQSLAEDVARIRTCARETLNLAGIAPSAIDRVIFVGGSSLMAVVSDAIRDEFPAARLEYSDALTAVVTGLALAAGDVPG
ncbi:Hsp70 family protein [Pseudoruegeria sp. SK021]|uniref:Hsp70 family protein n=1 Tax=Pseudoruegeria sp. SK021 TaxID=1933035 RepID=UPI000A24D76E|nr:Hsp70 family protein [Pseudoruegeria sp. SK021]OSP56596.1 hsp70 family protein [Pseudoruegeria sp. SK021]